MHGAMLKAEVFWRAGCLAVITASLLLGVSGCGSADAPTAAKSSANAKTRKQQRSADSTQRGDIPLSDMVAAVTATKGAPPVEMKFLLPSRPEVGQVLDVDVALIPRAPIPDSVSVSFQVVDGLEIVEGSQLERVDKLVDGTPLRHVVKVLPKRDGIFTVTAVVSFVASGQDSNRTFSIPVIAGEGMPEQVAKGP